MAKDRRLVVYEAGADPDEGRMFAIAPADAKGIALPTMEVVSALPAAGGVSGQLFYNKISHLSYVWTGAAFASLTPSIITAFDTDALLLAATLTPGSYANATDTGNLYVQVGTGWRQVGTHIYPTVNGLLLDTPADGAIGYAADEGSIWFRHTGTWICQTIRILADKTSIEAWAPPDGSMAFDQTTSIYYIRTAGVWRSVQPIVDTEANILAMPTAPLSLGQLAIATNTGNMMVLYDDAGTKTWTASPIMHFPDEATLKAASPPDGIIAFTDDLGLFFGRSGGAWVAASGIVVSVGDIATPLPATPTSGDLHLTRNVAGTEFNQMRVYDGAGWLTVARDSFGTDLAAPAGPAAFPGQKHYGLQEGIVYLTHVADAALAWQIVRDWYSPWGNVYKWDKELSGGIFHPELTPVTIEQATVNCIKGRRYHIAFSFSGLRLVVEDCDRTYKLLNGSDLLDSAVLNALKTPSSGNQLLSESITLHGIFTASVTGDIKIILTSEQTTASGHWHRGYGHQTIVANDVGPA